MAMGMEIHPSVAYPEGSTTVRVAFTRRICVTSSGGGKSNSKSENRINSDTGTIHSGGQKSKMESSIDTISSSSSSRGIPLLVVSAKRAALDTKVIGAFLEALQREHWRRRQQEADAGGGGFGLGPGDGFGEMGEDDFGPTEEIRFEDLFGDIFGSFGGGGAGSFDPRPGPGPEPDQGRTDGPGGQDGGRGGGAPGPEPAASGPGRGGGAFRPGYGPPPGHYGGGWYGYGPAFGDAARARRGGAGMTFADLFELYQSWPGPHNSFGDYDESGNMPRAYF
ncbi:hypothetical protein HER10_EVM0008747 [Colletotrichum scovillei]|uniref:Uncharacterized protein n=1 Tax=Colletotrichum scovillei TaxID=1209932 RepID=A0A9P7R2Y5_9PEZI|nr:uncharacterized protein HER10_EVM0008747 [Colletotrichum scovillei]KAF4780033.1 hypothetical protein HER10_EVM0008747 [Colletotrichum scovillei]KAG7046891.1 hypothetical protein JMJ77_0015109 [Colletotrichum scovillei]KAG7056731.1 hypothetical protein JMJ78_0000522 [Colletotrichum scovillei]